MRILVTISLAVALLIAGCGNTKTGTPDHPSDEAIAKRAALKEEIKERKAMEASNPQPEEFKKEKIKVDPPILADVGNKDEVAIVRTSRGDFVLEFYPDIAPLHVANFKNLAKAGFYNGIGFHRVLPGFVIQGGDPNTMDDDPRNDGMGGPGYSVKAEFNDRQHVHGTLSMARSKDPNSAGSQFFVCLGRTPHLDNKYTVFGGVIKGLDVVDDIGAQRRDPSKLEDREKPMVRMHEVVIVPRSEAGL